MFERFAQDARQTVVLAQEEACAAGHGRIGTEHLLLALFAEGGGTGHRALHLHGAEAEPLRTAVRELSPAPAVAEPEPVGSQAKPVRRKRGLLRRLHSAGKHIPFSTGAKQALEQSLHVALEGKDNSITSGHVLLGLLRIPGSTADRVLAEAGIDTATLRATTENLVRHPGSGG
ncbi:Clp protease N-terminal domain-containing protein [Streptomonospora algeriensis]|uniref:Clp protease N-terminal domain-containing protein n=1 Tax=Streptomonospora algeriensis TaxID=995084 RepID=A0ABW3BIA0_9ACTN